MPSILRRTAFLALAIAALAVAAAPGTLAQDAGKDKDKPKERRDVETKINEEVILTIPLGGMEVKIEEHLRDAAERHKMVMAFDEQLRGKPVRFYTSGPISFRVLKAVLSMYGVEIIFLDVDGRLIMKVFLQRNIQQNAGDPTPIFLAEEKLPDTEQIVTAVYHIKFADANTVQTALRAMQTRDPKRVGQIYYIPRSEILLIVDLKSNVEFYLKIAQAVDVALPGFEYKIVQVQYALADELANIVNNLYRLIDLGGQGTPGGAPPQPGQPQAPRMVPGQAGMGGVQAQVVADARTNKVVIVATEAEIPKIERIIRDIDVRVDPPPRHFHVYKCVNAYAEDLANALNSLFGGAATPTYGGRQRQTPTRRTTTGGGLTGGTSRQPYGTRQQGFQQPAQPVAQPAPTAGRAGAGPGLGQLNPGEGQIETRFVPDPQTNSILIQAAPDDYREILAVLKELDKKRMRVAIECQVWEILVSDDLFYAVDAAIADDASTERNPTPLRGHGFGSFGLLEPNFANAPADDPNTSFNESTRNFSLIPNFASQLIPATLPNGGLIFALTKGGFDKIPLILQALSTESNANLLTTPFAITNDNEPAEFRISESRPFSITSSNAVSNFSGFDRAEATSILAITPRISSQNNLTLQMELQIESFGRQQEGQPPESNTRAYTGTVTVPNRQYVIFGGLEQEAVRESRSKIPLVGDIPLLGYLFGRTSYGKSRTRIYVFVRPVIFAEDDFSLERKATRFLHDGIRADSLLEPERSRPVLPDEIIDAETADLRSAIYGIFGDPIREAGPRGETAPLPEHPKTREARTQMLQGK